VTPHGELEREVARSRWSESRLRYSSQDRSHDNRKSRKGRLTLGMYGRSDTPGAMAETHTFETVLTKKFEADARKIPSTDVTRDSRQAVVILTRRRMLACGQLNKATHEQLSVAREQAAGGGGAVGDCRPN
jgi:hypothetical protein